MNFKKIISLAILTISLTNSISAMDEVKKAIKDLDNRLNQLLSPEERKTLERKCKEELENPRIEIPKYNKDKKLI